MCLWAVGPAGQGVGSAVPLSLRPSGGLCLCRPKPESARGRLELGSRRGPWMLQLRCPSAQRKGTGRSLCTCQGRRRRPRPAHARPPPEGWDAEGRVPLSARARSLARAGRRLPRLGSRSEPLRRVRAWSRADPSVRVLWVPGPRRPLPAPSQPVPPLPRGMGPARLGVARPGPDSRSVTRCQPLPGSRRLALSLSQWRRRLR